MATSGAGGRLLLALALPFLQGSAAVRNFELEDVEGSRYAFTIKYNMQRILGVEISHTALLVCDEAKVAGIVTKFEAWCSKRQGNSVFKSCFWADNWGEKQPVNLLDGGCTEYEFADDDGIRVLPYGRSDFFEYFGDDAHIYPVGPVTNTAVSEAFDKMKSCGQDGAHLLDYNFGTYNFLTHNCHTFTDTMMGYLNLPYWTEKKGLPSRMTPESKKRHPVLGRVVGGFVVMFMGDPGPVTPSKWCQAQSCSEKRDGANCLTNKTICLWTGESCIEQCGTLGYEDRCTPSHHCKWFGGWCITRCSAYLTDEVCGNHYCKWKDSECIDSWL